jgi:1A family penicillin-binding protein
MSKRSKRQEQTTGEEGFFEALPSTLPLAPPVLSPALDSEWWRERGSDGRALAEDVWRLSKQAGRALGSKAARRIYIAMLILGLAAASTAAVVFASNTYAVYASDLNNPSALLTKKNTGTTILDRNGKVLYQMYGATTREPLEFSKTPQPVINATLAAEDPEFFQHSGISWRGSARALWVDITHGSAAEGGSTLTQQLVKNTLLTSDRTPLRKAQEIVLATAMEHKYSKQQIMELYLNGVYYGQGSYGIGAAAKTYFGKDASQLTLGESAMLAGLPLGPSRFDPATNPEVAKSRRDYVLDRMHGLGNISAEQLAAAKAEPLVASGRQIHIEAPHFVFYVLDQLRQQYGNDQVEHGGLVVTTTLDLDKQKTAEDIVRNQITQLGQLHVTNGALISTVPSTGEIISMVGSYNYYDPSFGSVNLTTADRQPGSSIKPLVYLDAFIHGWTPATVVDDMPLSLPDGAGGVWQPKDYDLKYRGRVTLRRALSNSLNIPAVNVLRFLGLDEGVKYAHTLGITTLNDPSSLGLSMVLGGGEVKMIDMATAYGSFANGGLKVDPVAIQSVKDRDGRDITIRTTNEPVRVADARYAYMLTSILSDNKARSEEFGTNSPLALSRPAAAKTGTTTDWRDNWTIGYTTDVVTVVWAGNNDNTPMVGINGITGAAPIWHNYMEAVLAGTPVHNFSMPTGMTVAKVCTTDGGLANPWDSSTSDEAFLAEAVPTKHCGSLPPAPPAAPAMPEAVVTPTIVPPMPPAAPSGGNNPGKPDCHGKPCFPI